MNTKTQIPASVVAGMLAGTTAANAAESGNLELSVTGLENDEGKVRIALFNAEEAYTESSEDEGAFRGVEVDIRGGQARHAFRDIPYGDYAIKLYHDGNGNQALDKNFFGLPTEPYGFSNNARGTLGAPSYDEAKFALDAPTKTIEIKPY